MNTLELWAALEDIPAQSIGVFPSDRIPKIWSRPAALIFNTDDHTKPGSHWVAFYVDQHGRGVFFDSFGLPPIIPSHRARIDRNCTFYRWNDRQLQAETSEVCGHYTVMFLHLVSSGLTLDEIHSVFGRDCVANDRIVKEYYNVYANKNVNARAVCCVQKCCSKKKN